MQPRAEGKEAVIILGSGPNRIGQGIEFDYSCVHASLALAEAGYETVMVNCNPETVSTDYDTSDRLYFEPLTAEDVIEIVRTEQTEGEVLDAADPFGAVDGAAFRRRRDFTARHVDDGHAHPGIELGGDEAGNFDIACQRRCGVDEHIRA